MIEDVSVGKFCTKARRESAFNFAGWKNPYLLTYLFGDEWRDE